MNVVNTDKCSKSVWHGMLIKVKAVLRVQLVETILVNFVPCVRCVLPRMFQVAKVVSYVQRTGDF